MRVDLSAPDAGRAQLEERISLVQRRSAIRDTLAHPVEVVTELA
ncbi:hypothetical protein [Streptomyces sp. NPDC059861]